MIDQMTGVTGTFIDDGPEHAVEFREVTKRYGDRTVVDRLSFTVRPGTVTGFLGPNGAGKTTTLRMLLGLVDPTSGVALVAGRSFSGLPHPASAVGAALEATGFHSGRRGVDHLRFLAAGIGVPDSRVHELLDLVGLRPAARQRVRGYSLGMRQRLALAAALLGDPRVLVLDEPANGLDPEGVAWLRSFLRSFAATGRTVLFSSHLLGEVEQTVDDVVLLAGGRKLFEGPVDRLRSLGAAQGVRVTLDDTVRGAEELRRNGFHVRMLDSGAPALMVETDDPADVGHVLHGAGLRVSGIAVAEASLEDVFLQVVSAGPAGRVGGEVR